MNILVIGGNGFIGQHLLKKLSKIKENKITNIYRNNLDVLLENIEHIRLNRKDIPQLQRFFKNKIFDVTIDLAAFTRKDVQEIQLNLETQLYVFLSSSAIYGNVDSMEILEDTSPILHSEHKYALNKWMAEREIEKNKTPSIILRPAIVYGPYDSNIERGKYFISQMKKKQIVIPGKVNVYNNYVYVDDLVDLIMKCLTIRKGKIILNVGGESFNWLEYVTTISKIMNLPVPEIISQKMTLQEFKVFTKQHKCHCPHNVFKHFVIKSLKTKTFQWNPKVTLEEGLKNTIDSLKKNL